MIHRGEKEPCFLLLPLGLHGDRCFLRGTQLTLVPLATGAADGRTDGWVTGGGCKTICRRSEEEEEHREGGCIRSKNPNRIMLMSCSHCIPTDGKRRRRRGRTMVLRPSGVVFVFRGWETDSHLELPLFSWQRPSVDY